MSNITVSELKTELLKKIAKTKDFDDVTMKISSGSMKGDGYLGIIYTVDLEEKKNPQKKLHLIVKSALSEEKLREITPLRKAYEREAFLYETVFPEFQKLYKECGILDQFTEIVPFYGSLLVEQEECIVLENLKELNFQMWNRKLAMNEEHVSLVFRTYAKLHASGIVLKHLNPERYQKLAENLANIFQKDEETEEDKEQFKESLKHVFGNGFRAVENNESATKALTRFAKSCKTFFTEEVRKIDKYSTILHGDCWCNNMMFQYEDEYKIKPSKMCLLDWQISNIGSPINDISYFLYACSSKEILYKLNQFLEIYHKTFSQILEEAGLEPEQILTLDELQEQWKRYSKFGLFMALFVMKVILGETDEAVDLSEMARDGKNLMESFSSTQSVNMEKINERIGDLIIFMDEFDYL